MIKVLFAVLMFGTLYGLFSFLEFVLFRVTDKKIMDGLDEFMLALLSTCFILCLIALSR